MRKILKEGVEVIPNKKNDDPELVAIVITLFRRCLGNTVRVKELLQEEFQKNIPYSTLTRWVREYVLREPKKRVGHYVFEPGMEMQHDTSPHKILISDKKITLQCASLVCAYSRKLYMQYYHRFTRFEAKTFLKEALIFFDGSCSQCIVDNTSVILSGGSGSTAIIAPEMKEFARIFGFEFKAHAILHADRKAYVERNFHYVENNFLPGRRFADLNDLNRQVLQWCEQVANKKEKRSLGMTPEAAFVMEKPYLQPMPVVMPPIYEHCQRTVDAEAYISFETHRYSVSEKLIGEIIDVYKYIDKIHFFFNHQEIAIHTRILEGRYQRSTLKGHHTQLWRKTKSDYAEKIERQLLCQSEWLDQYVKLLKKHAPGRGSRTLSRLLYFKQTYPADAFEKAITQAMQYKLYDMNRLESMIIKYVAGTYFNIN